MRSFITNFVTTVLTLAIFAIVGPGRVISGLGHLIVSAGLFVWTILEILAFILIKRPLRFLAKCFTEDFQEVWYAIYSRIGSPKCEICGLNKRTDERVVYQDACCEKWMHDTCHAAEKVALLLQRGETATAVALFALRRVGMTDFPLSSVMKVLRKKNPHKLGISFMIHRAMVRSREVHLAGALTLLKMKGIL